VTQEALHAAVEAFLAHGDAAGHTNATRKTYTYVLDRFQRYAGIETLADLTTLALESYMANLRNSLCPVSVHQAYRTLRTFTRYCVQTGRLTRDPMTGLTMRAPKTLPTVPDDAVVRRLLAECPHTPEGYRNRAIVALLADSGLRKEELRHLRLGDLDLMRRLIHVRSGKGQKDGTAFFGETTAAVIRRWLAVHPSPVPAAPLCCRRDGAMLGPGALVRILHRLSRRAGLTRKIGPHALRHYAATSLMRRTGDLELVRRVLRHETLTMALRYAALTQTEIAAKFLHASPLDHLRAPTRQRRKVQPRRATAAVLSRW
jgi:site-specific recombinase XerD